MKTLLNELFGGLSAIFTGFAILATVAIIYILFFDFPHETNKLMVYNNLKLFNIAFWVLTIGIFINGGLVVYSSFNDGKDPVNVLIKLIIPFIFSIILGVGLEHNNYKDLDKKYSKNETSIFDYLNKDDKTTSNISQDTVKTK